jgi:hypothetical protein
MSRAKGPPPTPRSQALAQFTHYRGENPSPKPPCYEKVCKNPCLAAALFVAETMQRHEDATPRGVRYPHSLRTWFDFGTKPLQRMIPEDMGIPSWSTWPCLGGRSLHKWSGGHLLEKFVCRGTPRVICTTRIVAHRLGAVGERAVPSGLCQDSCIAARRVQRSVPAWQL